MNVFKELYQNRKLIWKLSKNDFRNKFAGAYFGIIWAFIQPMVTVAVYFVVFQLGLRWISVYLLAGFRYYSVVLLF